VGKNTFEADAAEWVFLIGSPRLVVEQAGEVTLITSQADLVRARQYVGVFAGPLRAIIPFFPHADVSGLVLMVLGEESGLPENTPPVAGYPLVVTQRYVLINMATSDDFYHLFILRTLLGRPVAAERRQPGSQIHGLVTRLNMALTTSSSIWMFPSGRNGDPSRMLARVQSRRPARQL
jgi:hypothetical protein